MSLKIHKHFDYLTPFTEATSDEELAKIMRLKYPKACSDLETGAEFFARMVEGVRKHEAWKVIGFDSFESFCREKLGKTLDEVEEIVEGVKILGGNPTEEQAKKASKASKARDEMVKHPEKTDAQIGKELDMPRQEVRSARNKKKIKSKSYYKTPLVGMAKDPSRTARNIREKMGMEYWNQLITL